MLILDGAFGEELRRAHGLENIAADPLWGAGCIETHPATIQAVHTSYLAAGADVILTGTYQAAQDNLAQHLHLAPDAAAALMRRGIQHAVDARDAYVAAHPSSRKPPQIALSLGSYGAILADGSEFTGAFLANGADRATLADFHLRRLRAYSAEGLAKVDWLAFETLPTRVELGAVLDAVTVLRAEVPSLPRIWVSVTCRDGATTGAGDAIEDVARDVLASPEDLVLGINCTPPEYVTSLLTRVHATAEAAGRALPTVVYPNRGEKWDTTTRTWVEGSGLSDAAFAELARREWAPLGLIGVGGCCRTTPGTVAALRATFKAQE
ncbi:AdoMet-homocysteine methyltransferase [Blastocladiella emersonii ATCC 22665]|nr:AdoMet-homocysteine methyltransferase [Blastocladiella emersonii ATCC 22665]